MPSKPGTEPTLEELSSYLDNELGASDQARVAEHVASCSACQERLAGLRQTTYAIRGLPMESPPRSFANVLPRQRQWRWAPVGWVGSAAVAVLLIGVGLSQLHPGGAANTASSAFHANNGGAGLAYAPVQPLRPSGAVMPLDQTLSAGAAQRAASPGSTKTVSTSNGPSRSLTLSTDATSYPRTGVMQISVSTTGLSASEASSFKLWLVRDRGTGGYAIRLAPPSNVQMSPFQFTAQYSISQMPLQAPIEGSYTLEAEIDLSDGSALIAYLPVKISS